MEVAEFIFFQLCSKAVLLFGDGATASLPSGCQVSKTECTWFLRQLVESNDV